MAVAVPRNQDFSIPEIGKSGEFHIASGPRVRSSSRRSFEQDWMASETPIQDSAKLKPFLRTRSASRKNKKSTEGVTYTDVSCQGGCL
ncbi:hypothetical protein VTL71DRAFT_11559, partial [Oculimacula yallundae]